MFGFPPMEWGNLILAANTTVLLVTCVASLWLHRHRYRIRGMIRKLLWYL